MRHEKTVSVSKIKPLWEPWEEDETPRKYFTHIPGQNQHPIKIASTALWPISPTIAKILTPLFTTVIC